MAIQTINFSDLIFPGKSTRTRNVTDEDVVALAKDLATRGLLNLFTVYDMGDGTLSLGDGHGRYAALEVLLSQDKWLPNLEYGRVEVNVVPFVSTSQTLADQLAANVLTKQTTKKEFIDSLIYLQREESLSLEELSSLTGMSTTHITSLIKTIKLPDAVRELVGKGDISLVNATKLASTLTKVPESEQGHLIEMSIRQKAADFATTVEDINKEISEARKAERKENGPVVPVFAVKKKFIGKSDLEELHMEAINNMDEDATPFNEGYLEALNRAFSVDDASIHEQRQIFDTKLLKKEEAKEAKIALKKAEALKAAQDALEA